MRSQNNIAVHGNGAWLEAGVVADRHHANGEMRLFRLWKLVVDRINELLPEGWREELR
jgi:hypothetical protein